MVTLTRDEVLALARTAGITLAESEVDFLTKDIKEVLEYASSLKALASSKTAEPMPHPINKMRADETSSSPRIAEEILARAPIREENYFVVPMTVKHGQS